MTASDSINSGFRNYAFLSYSRRDEHEARWLHSALEWFRIPTELPPLPDWAKALKYVRPVFRDKKDLEVRPESFVEQIKRELAASRFLIVLCSPNAAQSRPDGSHYVDWEIRKFIQAHGSEYARSHILPVVLAGKPGCGDPQLECLPPVLLEFGPTFLEHNFPVLTDLPEDRRERKEAREDCVIGCVAFLLGVDRRVIRDRYLQAQRERMRQYMVLAAVVALSLAGLAVWAFVERGRAVTAAVETRETLARADFEEASRRLDDEHDTSRALAYLGSSLSRQPYAPAESRLQDLILHRSWLVEREAFSLGALGNDSFAFSPALDRVARWRAGELGAPARISLQTIGDGSSGKPVELSEPAVQAVFPNTAECVVTHAPETNGRMRCRFWRASDGAAVGNLLLEPGQTPVGVSPKGSYALIGDERGRTLSLVSTVDGRRLVELPGEEGWCWQGDITEPALLVFAPDESAVFVVERQGDTETFVRGKKAATPRVRIRGYATADGHELWWLEESGDIAHFVCAPDGAFVIYSYSANGAENWQLVLHPLKPETAAWRQPVAQMPDSLLLGPDGCTLAVADGNVVTLRSPYERGERRGVPVTLLAGVHDLVFSHDARRLAYVTKAPEVGVLDTETGALAVEPRLFGDEVFAAVFSRDDRSLHLRTRQTVRTFALQVSPVAPRVIKPASELPLLQVAADPQGRGVVLLSGDGESKGAVELHSPDGGAGAPPSFLDEPANAAAFSPDGKLLAVAAGAPANEDGGSLWLFDVPDAAWKTGSKPLLGRRIAVGGGMPRRIAIDADGRLALLEVWSRPQKMGHVVQVDLASGTVLPDFIEQANGVNTVAFSPDGRRFATAEGGRTVRIWDVVQRRQIGDEVRLGSSPETLEFSPDGTKLAVGSRYGDVRGTVQMLSAEGKPLWPEPRLFMSGVQKVRFAPDGVSLAVSFKNRTVVMLDAATGRPRTAPMELGLTATELCFLPVSGETRWVLALACGSVMEKRGYVQLWDVESGRSLGEPIQLGNFVRGLAALPDGRLAVGSSAGCFVRSVPRTVAKGEWRAEVFPSLVSALGGWSLNEWRAPEATESSLASLAPTVAKLPQWKPLLGWLIAPVEQRSVEPGGTVELDARLNELVTKGHTAEYRQVLDLRPDHAEAMAEYWFSLARETAETASMAEVKDRPREERMKRQMEWAQLSNEERRERIFANPKAKRLADFWTTELCTKHPELARAWQERATFLRLVGREAEAADALAKALSLGGGDFESREQLALLNAQQGDFAGAAEQFDTLCDWLEKKPPTGDGALRKIAKAGQNRLHFGTVGRGMDNVPRDVRWLADNLAKALAPISRLSREQGEQLIDASDKLTDFLARFDAGPTLSAEAHSRLIEALKGRTGTTNFETVQATLLGHRAFAAILARDTVAAQRDLAEAKRICPDLEVGLEVWRAHALAIDGRADEARPIYETMLELDAEMAGALSKELALDFQRLQRRGIALRGLEELQRRVFQRVASQPNGRLVVSALRPGDQAEKAGIKVGDRLVSYAGEPVLDWDWFVWERQIESRQGLREPRAVVVERDGKQLSFQVQSGRLGLGAKQP